MGHVSAINTAVGYSQHTYYLLLKVHIAVID